MATSNFGELLKQLIKKEGLSQQDFHTKVGIGKPYFYDIVSGKVAPPPPEVQYRMIGILTKATLDEKNRFFDIAAKERNEIPADIAKLINDNPNDIGAIRKILSALLVSRTIKLN
jgi:transcriptional regulator with XRE-family HTH domain